ncbi:hypothetical protein PENTCL1PPCAC_23983 [Pristionchus entomophagus]|uniref:C3H1-type domain-containing protein n=1 Tax=Pristionchus entomophagus TaxID=358040 RepID=A0AAV5U6R4_9BILA|nr:hypothetical protein PENTCL1PPCAC_23983 [Pristionchus entomophagus]
MDPNMQQQPQYCYAPGAPAGGAAPPPPGYYSTGAGDSAPSGYVLPMSQPQQMMYYAPAPHGACPAPGYAYAAPMYYQPPEAAFAAMSLSGQTMLPMQQQQPQPQQTPGASSTTSNGSQPRASSTPIPNEESAGLGAPPACNPTMIPMQIMYTQMPQYYSMPGTGYEGGAQMMPMVYQDPNTGQMMQHMQPMQQQHQHQYPPHLMNRMMSTDPDAIPENIDDISQISHQSSPDSFMEAPGQQRHPSTPVSSMRRRVSLPPVNQNLLPSNYKTRLCTQWLDKRECSMGAQCKFAHGNAELRLPERPFRAINNPKYKTKMCKNYEPGANGECAYGERCEYIHPTDREYHTYRARAEAIARARGDFPRYKAMFDEVPGVPRRAHGAGGSTSGGCDADVESSKSVRSEAGDDSSYGGERTVSPPPPRGHRRGNGAGGGYLGTAMPPSVTRSAIRMGAGADAAAPQPRDTRDAPSQMRRGFAGGSMYNLASGTYTDNHHRDEYRARLARVPSASNVGGSGYGNGAGGGGAGGYRGDRDRARYGAAPKFNRRASMCHLNTAADY